MVKVEVFFGVVSLLLFVYCLVEAISTPAGHARNLPKVAWILMIIFLPFAGSVAWLAAGRPVAPKSQAGASSAFPEYERPGRAAGVTPESDEEFLRRVRERAEEQRRKEAERRKAQEDEEPEPS